jgi:hypothetical protein
VPDAALAVRYVKGDAPLASSFTALLVADGSGFYEVESPGTGGPTGSGIWYCYNLLETNTPTTNAVQIAINISDQNEIYMHNVVSGVAGAWRKMWHAGNDGAGSGLDADLLDGLSSAAYAQLAAASNFTTAPTINSATIWTSGNDGAGTGLDADLLDGVQGSGYALVAAGVPSGAIVAFRTAAEVTAAGAGWAVETNLAGKVIIGAGTAGGATFTEATNYGTNWTVASAVGSPATGAVQSGGASTANPSHTHDVLLTPPSRAYVYGRKS